MLNLDTHILVHAMDGGLTAHERDLLGSDRWAISAAVIWEIVKLAQIGKIARGLDDPLVRMVLERVIILPVTAAIAEAASRLDFKSDPMDELIAATSLAGAIPLVTRDRKIRASKVVPLAI